MLNVEGLETAYGASQVLFGISFGVGAGEVVTLLGRNGMGKTTTIRSIMGLVKAKAGTITFEGDDILGLPPFKVAQFGLGLVPEGRQIFPNLSVRENLVATAARRSDSPRPWTLGPEEAVLERDVRVQHVVRHMLHEFPQASPRRADDRGGPRTHPRRA